MIITQEQTPAADQEPYSSVQPRVSQTILIVDDFTIDRRIAGSIVEKHEGLTPIYASNGKEALELIGREMPLVVLTDLQMPEMDGLALVEGIRERFPRLPVILMTAHGSEEVAILALRAGATSYVPKKTLGRDLPNTLRQVLSISAESRKILKLLSSLERRMSKFRLENDPNLFTPMIQMLHEDLIGMGLCDATTRMRIGVALQEALSNALYHGNLEVSSDLRQDDERVFYAQAAARRAIAPYRDRLIEVDVDLDRKSVVYTIRDQGPGFDTSSLDRPIDPEDLMKIGGRGMLLIRTFMDEVKFNEVGNQITLTKHFKPAG